MEGSIRHTPSRVTTMAPQARGDNHDAKRLEGELEKLEKVGGSKLAELIYACAKA